MNTVIIENQNISVNMHRDFKGVWIPKEIWLAKGLGCQEKCLWAEIHSLHDRKRGGCYASNEYLQNFLGIQERRLREMISKLKSLGWLQQVSFDGRVRILRAVVPPEDFKSGPDEPDESPGRPAEKCRSEERKSAGPSIHIEQSLDNNNITPISPEPSLAQNAAKAAQKDSKPSSKSNFEPKVREVGEKLLEIVQEDSPSYIPPKNLSPFFQEVQNMLKIDKRKPEALYAVLRAALQDQYYGPGLLNGNLAKKLREKFATLEKKMNPKPKERKFAPCSNQEAALAAMEEMNKRAL